MIIAFHFQVKHFGLTGRSGGNKIGFRKLQNASTNLGELRFNPRSIILHKRNVFLVFPSLLLLLNGGDNPPRGTQRADDVLVGAAELAPDHVGA